MSRLVRRPVASQALAGLALLLAAEAGAQGSAAPLPGDSAVVAARMLARGTVLTLDDLVGIDGRSAESLPLGWVTRRIVRAGEPLRPPAIGRAPVLRAGSRVRAVATRGLVRITREGTAIGDGARGDTVLVRFPKQAAVPAIVVDSLTVSLVPPSSR